MSETVVAVVVTYNRKTLLVKCLDGLIEQAYPLMKIIIIDNASTDGTEEHLKRCGYIDNQLFDYNLLPINVGGAGGFHRGLELAMMMKPDNVWLMDDDGRPDSDCLAELVKIPLNIRAPIVIDDNDSSITSFEYRANGVKTKLVSELKNLHSIAPVHPFNGVLLSSELIRDIGLPDPRFFIWGDELDYRARWLAAGYEEASIPKAKFFHPSDRQIIIRSNKRSLGVPLHCSSIRKYCYYRNQTHLLKKRIGFIRSVAKIVFTIPDLIKCERDRGLFFMATYHGIFGIFGRHVDYLK